MSFVNQTRLVLVSMALVLSGASAHSQSALAPRVVTGTIRDATSRAGLPSVSVQLVDTAGERLSIALTDSSGRFRVYPPAPGTYRIRAQRVGYLRSESPLVRVDSLAVVVDIRMTRGAVLDSMLVVAAASDRPLRPTQQLVRGRLLDDDTRQPLENGVMELRDSRDQIVAESPTDRNGLFRLVTPSPGTYSMRGRRLGYTPATQDDLKLKLGDTVRVDFHLARHAALLGPVLITESAKPWAGRHETNREAELYARMARFANLRHAQFILRETIDDWDRRQRTMGEMLSRVIVPGVPRGPACSGSAMYVEGFQIPEDLPLGAIDLIEVYTNPTIPSEFTAFVGEPGRRSTMVPPCRVVSVWLRPKKR